MGYPPVGGRNFLRIPQAYWVPRLMGGTTYKVPRPTAFSGMMPVNTDPWPEKVSDKTVSTKPFISDECQGGGSTNVAQIVYSYSGGGINFYNGHFLNGKLHSVNLGFVDGHVETHTYSKIQWQWAWLSGPSVWFY